MKKTLDLRFYATFKYKNNHFTCFWANIASLEQQIYIKADAINAKYVRSDHLHI